MNYSIKPNHTVSITPRLCILAEDQKETIFSSVLKILEQVGVRVDNKEGLELLNSADAKVEPEGRTRIPSYLVEDAIRCAPSQITMYNRLGKPVMALGGNNVYFSSQIDCAEFDDPFERVRRPCVRTDTRMGAILSDALQNISMVSPSAMYSDVPAEIAYLVGHKEVLMHTVKPIMHGTMSMEALKAMIEMAAVVDGGEDELAKRPYYLHFCEPLSPLIHTDEGVAKLLYCAEHGVPTIYAPACVGGGTMPVTGAGLLVNCLAETLSGLVMAQLKRRGAPVIIGGVTSVLDMTTTVFSYGAPEMSLWSAGMTEMAHYLRLPVMSTAGCTDAVMFDEQAAAESAISCLMAALSGGNLVHDVGFAESANHSSLELIAATDEFISMIGHIMKGIEVSPETLALDVINEAGPGGAFIDKKHTFDHFRKNWRPSLMNRISNEGWKAAGSPSLGKRTNERVCSIIREHQPEPLPKEVAAELDKMERRWFQKVK